MPFNFMTTDGGKDVPRVLINMENTKEAGFDFEDLENHPERLFLNGKCDDTLAKLCKDLGWYDELQTLIAKCEAKYKPVKKATPAAKTKPKVDEKKTAGVAKAVVGKTGVRVPVKAPAKKEPKKR
jgi:hypothetical protein